MVKITMNVEGMACPRCEAHMVQAIKKAFNVKRITASHTARKCEIIAKEEIAESVILDAVKDTGYVVSGIKCEPYKKFWFFGK